MRVDSCRNCGSLPTVLDVCSECSQPTKIQCKNCKKFVDDPIHVHEKILV